MPVKVSQLRAAGALTGAEALPLVQDGDTRRSTVAALAALAGGAINVRQWGAVGDGAADDTAALQDAIAFLGARTHERALFFPEGRYLISEPLTVSGQRWNIFGVGRASTILRKTDGDLLRIDMGAGHFADCVVRDLCFAANLGNGVARPNTNAIHIHNPTPGAGANEFNRNQFSRLFFNSVHRAVLCDELGKTDWSGSAQLQKMGNTRFSDFHTSQSSPGDGTGLVEVFRFHGGLAGHMIFSGGVIGATSSCFNIGTGPNDSMDFASTGLDAETSCGDTLISDIIFTNGATSIRVRGPEAAGYYNQNFAVVGCQFEGATVATAHLRNMSRFRLKANQGTSNADYLLENCSAYTVEDRRQTASTWGVRAGKTVGSSATGLSELRPPDDAAPAQACVVEVDVVARLTAAPATLSQKWHLAWSGSAWTAAKIGETVTPSGALTLTAGAAAEVLTFTLAAPGNSGSSAVVGNVRAVAGDFRFAAL